MRAEEFGRINHLPPAQLVAVVDRLDARALVDAAGWFSDAGREQTVDRAHKSADRPPRQRSGS